MSLCVRAVTKLAVTPTARSTLRVALVKDPLPAFFNTRGASSPASDEPFLDRSWSRSDASESARQVLPEKSFYYLSHLLSVHHERGWILGNEPSCVSVDDWQEEHIPLDTTRPHGRILYSLATISGNAGRRWRSDRSGEGAGEGPRQSEAWKRARELLQ